MYDGLFRCISADYFFITFSVIFYLAYRYLKPFRMHRKRTVSTISLKISYLMYLALFLYFLFFVLFFQVKEGISEFPADDLIIRLYFAAVISISVLPNLGIVFRRRFKHSRTNYNVALTVMNLLICLLLVLFILYDRVVML